MNMLDRLTALGIIEPLDSAFARFMGRIGPDDPAVALAAALASQRVRQGNICLSLPEVAGTTLRSREEEAFPGLPPVDCPPLEAWLASLEASPLVGAPGELRPLILDRRSRLYLQRYYQHETVLARRIMEQAAQPPAELDPERMAACLAELFPHAEAAAEWDAQMLAVVTAALKRFCVISGGPGTGKTTTAVQILKVLTELTPDRLLRIELAAPTGKAAARLSDAVRERFGDDAKLPSTGKTVHRLLGELSSQSAVVPDVLVVDEASMADLSLMSRLMNAVSTKTRIIWLGDKDQLSSVEAGAVLGDVCAVGASADLSLRVGYSRGFLAQVRRIAGKPPPSGQRPSSRLRDCIVLLEKNYRFGEGSGIGAASRAINQGNGREALAVLRDSEDTAWVGLRDGEAFSRSFARRVGAAYRPYVQAQTPEEAFRHFAGFRVLCAVRRGPYGSEAVNRRIENLLAAEGFINPYRQWYHRRPILISRNDYSLRLFNGDVGIILPSEDRRLEAFFPDGKGGFRRIPPIMLPEHETVFAMTVHKSQGSEYEEVLFLLPPVPSDVLTRELLYTAVTRARKRVEVWGKEEIFLQAADLQIRRDSGLREALWGDGRGAED